VGDLDTLQILLFPADKSLVEYDPAVDGAHKFLELTRSPIDRTLACKNWIKQLHTLLVFHFNRCLTFRNRASYI
jgi:hypothetical protein